MRSAVDHAVITGVGVLASNGVGWELFGKALFEGRCGLGEIVSFDASDLGREKAGEIVDFEVERFLRSPKNYLDRQSALGFAACEMAVRQSGLELPAEDRRPGLAMGAMGGDLETLCLFVSNVREKGPRLAPPFLFPHTYSNATAGLLSIEYGLGGPQGQFCSGGAAGLEAVAFAADCIERGRTRAMIAGGPEAFGQPLFRLAAARGWLSPTDGREESCRPFGRERNGTILGEGAAALTLESTGSARDRGGRSLACVLGAGVASSPRDAMTHALQRGGVEPSSVGVVFAAAGGYAQEDAEEAGAIADVFGDKTPRVVALKALIGETLGASGPLNLAAALATLEKGQLPRMPEDCRSEFQTLRLGGGSGDAPVRTALVNAGSPGTGRWVSVVVGREEP